MRPVAMMVSRSLLCLAIATHTADAVAQSALQSAASSTAPTAAPTAARAAAALPRSTPEAQGLSSAALLAFVDEAEQKLDALHSLMIVRHGQVVAEGWWAPYAANEPHMMFSLSKSFTSTAAGLAVADGKLTVDDPVLGFFPDEAPAEPSANLKAMRVRDLLTMSTGHHEEAIRDFNYMADDSVVKRFLALPVAHKPGTYFFYNTPASYMLSAIVQKVTGQTVLDYLGPRLFEPLGIENPTWDASKQGISLGGFGLSVRTEDIARLGQLYLQKGLWKGKQLIPATWVDTATARHVSNGSSPSSDWEQGYGYQFWRSRHGFYRGDGAHGQFCLVLPQHDTVIAITSGTRDMASVMNLVWDRLVPALQAKALPPDRAAQAKLTARLQQLTLRKPGAAPSAATAVAQAAVGRRYVFPSNPQGIEAITLEAVNGKRPSGDRTNGRSANGSGTSSNGATGSLANGSGDPTGGIALTMRVAGADLRIEASPETWRTQTVTLRGAPTAIASSAAWTADETCTLTVVRYRTPFATTYKLRVAEDQLTVDVEQNVGPVSERTAQLIGKRENGTSAQHQRRD